jgi:hypothetical protein
MKTYFTEKLAHLTELLKEIESIPSTPLDESIRALEILTRFNEEFKQKLRQADFSSPQEEIYYFRYQRPELTAHLLYHNKRYHIELGRPIGSPKHIREYYRSELRRIDQFFEQNEAFIRYLRSGTTDRDDFFFRRNNISFKTVSESSFCILDENQTTNYDFKAGKFAACMRLADYLNHCIAGIGTVDSEDSVVGPQDALSEIRGHDRLLKSHQVERKLSISSSTLKRMRDQGKIPFIKVQGTFYYEEGEILKFIARNRRNRLEDL